MTDQFVKSGIGCTCHPCKSCIMSQISLLEKNKLYKEADQLFTDGIIRCSSIIKDLETERRKFRSKLKHDPYFQKLLEESQTEPMSFISQAPSTYVGSTCNNYSQRTARPARYQSFVGEVANDSKSQTLSWPVAIFDTVTNTKQKCMYPKHLIYTNGREVQLEELRAATYWSTVQTKSTSVKTTESVDPIKFTITPSAKNSPNDITNLPARVAKTDVKASSETNEFNPPIVSDVENIGSRLECVSHKSKPTILDHTDPCSPAIGTSLKAVPNASKSRMASAPAENHEHAKDGTETVSVPEEKTAKVSEAVPGSSSPSTKCIHNEFDASQLTASSVSSVIPIRPPVDCQPPVVPTIVVTNTESDFEKTKENLVAPSQKLQQAFEAVVTTVGTSDNKTTGRSNAFARNCDLYDQDKQNIQAPPSSRYTDTFNLLDVVEPPMITFEDDSESVPATVVVDACNGQKNAIFGVTFDISSTEQGLNDDTCDTKAFALMLPSSTPNRRECQVFKHVNNANGTYTIEPRASFEGTMSNAPIVTTQNLSMILELSKERSSSSSGGSSEAGNTVTSKVWSASDKASHLSAINETDENGSGKANGEVKLVPDPFDLKLIQRLLEQIKFSPENDPKHGCRINADMPLVKQSSTVKLGAEKFVVIGEIGKGSYARILKAHPIHQPSKMVALKQQKPACLWEYYISEQIRCRLNSTKCEYFIEYSSILMYNNGSLLMSKWAPYGSILNLINTMKSSNLPQSNRCQTAVVVYLSIQLITTIEYLHSCQIIHGDVKPDNFILYRGITSDKPCIKLIDYGRSIDMTLLPKNAVFTKIVTTEDFTCNEMKEHRPWTYQTDLYGLAGTMYLLLVGEYMRTTKRQDGTWTLKKPLSRYMNKELWDPIFKTLLNVPSCFEQPNLADLRGKLQDYYSSMDKYKITQHFGAIPSAFRK